MSVEQVVWVVLVELVLAVALALSVEQVV